MSDNGHIPVLLNEVLEHANGVKGKVFVDGTFGGGGYTKEFLEAGAGKVIALDRDPEAIARGQKMVKKYDGKLQLVETKFSEMEEVVKKMGITKVDGVLLDVGVSSFQIDTADRGFSFRFDAPLDMRMEKNGMSAADVLAEMTEKELADIFWQLGEEKNARQIARRIVEVRETTPIKTTKQLADLVSEFNPKWKMAGRHPAMRVFQALRIFVNDELGELKKALVAAVNILNVGGRLEVVSFHSLEDRIVKNFMREMCGLKKPKHHFSQALPVTDKRADYVLPFKKAIEPSAKEIESNPRARSSKLRVMEKVA